MAVILWKDGNQHRVEALELHAYLKAGYTLTEETHAQSADAEEVGTEDGTEANIDWHAQYEEKFGERPHHRMKLETIIEKVNGD